MIVLAFFIVCDIRLRYNLGSRVHLLAVYVHIIQSYYFSLTFKAFVYSFCYVCLLMHLHHFLCIRPYHLVLDEHIDKLSHLGDTLGHGILS